MDQLIGPQSPDLDTAHNRRPNRDKNFELLDRLLEEDPAALEPTGPGPVAVLGAAAGAARGHYKRVFDYDHTTQDDSSGLDTPDKEAIPECSSVLVHHSAEPLKDSEEVQIHNTCVVVNNGKTDTMVTSSSDCFDDSGKSSMENVSSSDNFTAKKQPVNSIVRSRPSPKNPVTQLSSPLVLTDSSSKGSTNTPSSSLKRNMNGHQQQPGNEKSRNTEAAPVTSFLPANSGTNLANGHMEGAEHLTSCEEPKSALRDSGASYENVPLGDKNATTKPRSASAGSSDRTQQNAHALHDGYAACNNSSDRHQDSGGDSGVVVDLRGASSLHRKRDKSPALL